MIVLREPLNLTSTSIATGASTSSVISAYMTRAGVAVDVGLDLLRFNVKTFFVKNQGPLAPLVGALEATNIPAEQRQGNDWEIIDATTFAAVLAGSAKSRVFAGDGRRYWRLRMSSTGAAVAIANVTAR